MGGRGVKKGKCAIFNGAGQIPMLLAIVHTKITIKINCEHFFVRGTRIEDAFLSRGKRLL